MAEEEKAPVEDSAEEGKGKKGGSKKRILMAIAAVLLLGGGGFAGWKFFLADKMAATEGATGETGTEPKEADPGSRIIHEMKPFIVNLLGNQGKRYLKARVDIEVGSKEVEQELKERQSQLRDAILLLLASKSFDDVSHPEGKTQLRNELIGRINEILHAGPIQALYFTEFVVQ